MIAPTNGSALKKRLPIRPLQGEDDYLSANLTYLDSDDFHVLGAAEQEQIIHLMSVNSEVELRSQVVIDTGCTRHSFADRSAFITYEPIQSRPNHRYR